MSLRSPMGMNSDVLKIKAETARPASASHWPRVTLSSFSFILLREPTVLPALRALRPPLFFSFANSLVWGIARVDEPSAAG